MSRWRQRSCRRWAPLALGVVVCCGEEIDTPAAAPTPVAVTPTPAAAPAPATPSTPGAPAADAPAAPTWSYSPVGKRDPFRSYLADLKAKEGSGQEQKLEETEMFELDQYRLTGLVTGTAQPSAMVEDPRGKGHVLRIGSKLGKNGGRVTRIVANGIVVTEEIRSPTGERVRVPITVALPKPEIGLVEEP